MEGRAPGGPDRARQFYASRGLFGRLRHLEPRRIGRLLAHELEAGRQRHGLDDRGEVLLEIRLGVVLQGRGPEVRLQRLARGRRHRHRHLELAPGGKAEVEVLAQKLGREGRRPVEVHEGVRLVAREDRAHDRVVHEVEEGAARHARLLGEDRDLGQVLRHDAEEDVVGDLAEAGELALADVGDAVRGDRLDHGPTVS